MGSVRKYLMNGAIISAVFSGISALRHQRRSPSDWRTVLNWIAWALTLTVAIGTVRIESRQAALDSAPKSRKHDGMAHGPKPAKDS